jgi:hypothetical protein
MQKTAQKLVMKHHHARKIYHNNRPIQLKCERKVFWRDEAVLAVF